MIVRTPLRRDEKGVTAIEFAMALPVLVVLMLGILQMAMVLAANGAMRNALGEGLRLAKVNPDATNEQVLAATRYSLIGVHPDAVQSLTFQRAEADQIRSGTIALTIRLNPVVPFVPLPPITLTQKKKVFLPK